MAFEHGCIRRTLRCIVLAAALLPILAWAASYVYDANGRLRAVTTAAGDSSEYIYDALGNLYAVNAVPAGQLAIFAFSPNHGSVGTSVTILGQGFNSTSSLDTVKFNGTLAAVANATAKQLQVTVPVGATTGTISVQVGTSLTTSIDIFTITSDQGSPPTISSFSPTVIASTGSTIVTGSNFQVTAGPTSGRIGNSSAAISGLSAAQLTLTPSVNAASGLVAVSTPYGTAYSAQPLIVLPAGIAATSVLAVDNVAVDGSAQSLSITATNSYGIYAFQGIAGQWLSFQFSQATPTAGVNYSIYDPNQTKIQTGTVSSGGMSIHVPQLYATGTYLVVFSSGSSSSVQLTAALKTDPFITADGATVPLATTSPSQSIRAIFELSTQYHYSLGISNLGTSPTSNDNVSVSIFRGEQFAPNSPLNYAIATASGCNGTNSKGCHANIFTPPATTTYGALIAPQLADTLSFSATLSTSMVGSLTLGVAAPINLSRPGQTEVLSFNATAGDLMGAYLNLVTTSPSGQFIRATILNADGSTIPGALWGFQATSNTFENFLPIPSTGNYIVFVEPFYAVTGTGQVTVIKDIVQTITVDSAPLTLSTTLPGEFVYLYFSGTAGQNLSLVYSNVTSTPSGTQGISISVAKPDGTNTGYGGYEYPSDGPGIHFDLLNLPVSGIYAIKMQPGNTPYQTMTFAVSVLNALTGSFSLNTPNTVSLGRPGEIAVLTLPGAAGDLTGMYMNNVSTTPSGKFVYATVLTTAGGSIGGAGWGLQSTTHTFENFLAFPSTTTYEVLVEPSRDATSSAQLTWTELPVLTGVVNGSATSFATTYAGETAYLKFAGIAGQPVRLKIASLVMTPTTAISATLYESSGSYYFNLGSCSPPGCTITLPALPINDTYSIKLYNSGPSTMSFTATLLSP